MAQYAPYAASAEWHPSLSNQHRGNILTHSKRKAEDELESQVHISSHFKKLRLNQNPTAQHANAIPPSHTAQHHYPFSVPQQNLPTSPTVTFRPHIANTDARPALLPRHFENHPIDAGIAHQDFAFPPPAPPTTPLPPYQEPAGAIHPPTLPDDDFMTIDDTPNRIIIHDLSTEIALIEAEEAARNATLFLPDIDKKVSSLPAHVLQAQNHDRMDLPRPPENVSTALILYRDPSSISVPEEEDVVRKTIMEARRRSREKTAVEQREREAETRALQEHWDEGMVDHSFHGADDVEDGEMDDDLDSMDIE